MTEERIRSTPSTHAPQIAMVAQDKRMSTAFRKPRRVTITIPHATYLELERRSYEQGRSLSNLSAYLLECAISEPIQHQPTSIVSATRVMTAGHPVR